MADKSKRICVNKEDWNKLSTDEHADICSMMFHALVDKAEELSELYDKFQTTYPGELAIAGISLVVSVNSKAFDKPPCLILTGTAEGLMHNMIPLMKASHNAITEAMEDDKESA